MQRVWVQYLSYFSRKVFLKKIKNLKGRMVKSYVTQEVVVDEVHETISFRQSEILKK